LSASVTFTPVGDEPRVGLIFYSGGRVDPRAYATLLREVADRGYLVVAPPMTLNLAVLSPDRADEVIADHPEIDTWAMSGHSLGGAMSARYTRENSETIRALTLLAAYPAGSDDLSDSDAVIVSAYGTRDGVVDPDAFSESVELLPADAAFLPIEGGNHAQFGSYGLQAGDAEATISAEDQQWQAADAIGLAMRPLRIRTH
jgi:pimeloyl-ACP methyl ester carboxylesterase